MCTYCWLCPVFWVRLVLWLPFRYYYLSDERSNFSGSSGSASSNTAHSSGSGSGQVSIGEVNTIVEERSVTSTLTINSIQYHNFGVYRCVAYSDFLKRLKSIETTLHGRTRYARFVQNLSLSLQSLLRVVHSSFQLK